MNRYFFLGPTGRVLTRAAVCAAAVCAAFAGFAPPALGQSPSGPFGFGEASLRQVLDKLGVDESHFNQLLDDEPVGAGEQETIIKLLSHTPSFAPLQITRWRKKADWTALARDPAAYRGQYFRASGRVADVTERPLPVEMARRWEIEKFYRVEFTAEPDGQRMTVFSRHVPEAWLSAARDGRPTADHASFDGIFLKTAIPGAPADALPEIPIDESADDPSGSGDTGAAGSPNGDAMPAGEVSSRRLVFVTNRIEWRPVEPDPRLHVTPGRALLGKEGVDIGVLDRVTRGGQLTARDREPFYQMLAAVRGPPPPEAPPVDNNIEPMMLRPKELAGDLVTMRGLARRALKVHVEDPDIRERFGITHYYEIYVFVPLRRGLIFKDDEGNERRYTSQYPVVFYATELPEGFETGGSVRQETRITGHFLKLYDYGTEYASEQNPDALQRSPMIIAYEPHAVPDEALTLDRSDQWWLGGFFAAAIIGVWVGVWLLTRAGRNKARTDATGEDRPPDFGRLE